MKRKGIFIASALAVAVTILAVGGIPGAGVRLESRAEENTSPGGTASSPAVSPNITDAPESTSQPAFDRVTGLSAKKASSLKKVTLSWNAVPGAQGYIIYRKKGKAAFAEIARTDQTGYVDKKAAPGGKYDYQVCAWQTAGDGSLLLGERSAEVRVSLKPGKVKGLKAKSIRHGVSLRWKKTKNVNGYQVYMKVFVKIKGIKTKYNRMKTTKSRKYRKRMLVPGKKFGFMVRAYKKVNGKKIYGSFSKVIKRAG